jgi:hypothetical protein
MEKGVRISSAFIGRDSGISVQDYLRFIFAGKEATSTGD